ncbi:hypothetical protein Aperf_G00000033524 [Anoplocephala perfoliata]
MRRKPAHNPKMQTPQGLASGDTGLVSTPLATYHLIRNFMGNTAEVHTSTHVSIGVIKAISPSGGMGLLCVRTAPIGSEDGPFTVEKDRFIPFSEIRKVVARNVNPAGVNKDEKKQAGENDKADDADDGLEKFYVSGEEADACSLNSDEHFSPEQMFEVNKQKYNVKSTYNENLEGYTVQLNKSDPDFKRKEEFYAKVAKEIEENENMASTWETTAENEIENEEIKFSAVLKEGVQGRELKNVHNRGGRRARGSTRMSLPHPSCEAPESDKPEPKPVKSNSSTLPREQSKSTVESVASKPLANIADKEMSKASQGTASIEAIPAENPVSNEQSDAKSMAKLDFDPDAPVFEPSQSLSNESPGASPITTAVFTQPLAMVSNSAISQQSIPNGNSQTIAFSSLPCVGPGVPQFLPFRPTQVGFTPQQFTMIAQQYPALSAAANQANIQSSRGQRPNAPGGYSKQRSLDQANAVSVPVFPAFGYSGSYSLGVPLMPSVAGNIALAHPIHAVSGSVSASPSVQQSSASVHSNPSAAGQVNHMNSGSQTVSSPSPAQGAHYHPGFNPQLVQNPTGVSAYPQYPTGQFVGSQTVGSLGYYPQAVYQTPGGLIYPMQQIAGGNQSQLGPQVHNHGQQPLIPQPLQLQPPQGSAPQQQLLYTSYPFSPQATASAAAHAVSVNMPQQNAFVHPQVQLYMAQQPNSTG